MTENYGMNIQIEDLKKRRVKANLNGGQKKIDRHNELGFYTARQRIAKLVDSDTFLELGKLAHSDQAGAESKSAGDGIIAGLAKVNDRPVVIQAADKTVFAATEGMVYFRKMKSVHRFAVKRGIPMINLMEGGGLRMPDGMGSDGISQMLFPQELLLHQREVPIITAILGDSFGGPTWSAVSSDFVTQVKGTAMAVAGPRMLSVATGEKISNEELGGWQVHAEHTGQIDSFVEDEDSALKAVKEFLEYMPLHGREKPNLKKTKDKPHRMLEKIADIVPTKQKRAYDMKKVIKEIVDDGDYFELKSFYGKALITCLARLDGRVVGIIANNPIMYAGAAGSKECEKATEFIVLCDSYNIPLVFLHDTPGFRVSSEAEKAKIPTKIMVWNQALAQSTVPKVSVVVRKSIGAAYGNMCGPTMGADFVVAWPTAEINFTGPEVGINVVYGQELKSAENPEEKASELLDTWSFDSSPYKAAGKYLIDDVIDPRDTRKFLSQTFEYIHIGNKTKSNRNLANWPTGF